MDDHTKRAPITDAMAACRPVRARRRQARGRELTPMAETPRQLSLFGDSKNRMQPPVRSYAPDPASIRKRLHGLLAQVQGAQTMPWAARDALMWETVFPQMANWLPQDQADELRAAFAREIERLKGA
ncbi:MAG: hypothetical protein Q8L59_16375 [Phenylobacterium sp.]|uniref:hypothetical protein n=1 Tax=Phenylobacterium sp. TaxID=1871053 RepID=UPI0027328627|nr:hypothetical protein [Phenylobacterium sp.]MDP1643749.1 hypothetical protein [Phenylobacterium sp.]MDP3118112.1 hypothetical protein [Phenylobacterium sp.]